MSDDEPTPDDDDELEDLNAANGAQLKTTNDDDDEQHQLSDMEHEKEDLQELEKARKERMDLMAAELKNKQEAEAAAKEGEVVPFDKFQYLVGQSEVFAHFLAGELLYISYVYYYVYLFMCMSILHVTFILGMCISYDLISE